MTQMSKLGFMRHPNQFAADAKVQRPSRIKRVAELQASFANVSQNAQLAVRSLPSLQIRIGIHTGSVLSGVIGSDRNLKVGCMGDPVNLASRLEGVCKVYDCGIICSKDTFDSLPPAEGFVCRQLDIAQVVGRAEPVVIYEVMDMDVDAQVDQDRQHEEDIEMPLSMTPAEWSLHNEVREHARCYEKALAAYQCLRLAEARSLTEALLAKHPDDVAAQKLRQRCLKHLGGSTGDEIVGLSAEERNEWRGVHVLTEK